MEVPQRQLILVQLSKLINFMIRVKAYLNEPDSNYETYVSVLLAARLADKPVTIYSNRETKSGKNHCHIGYIAL